MIAELTVQNSASVASVPSCSSPTLLFAVPPSDTSFHRLGAELCQETWLALARLKQIHFARNKTREAERIAAGLQSLGNKRGTSSASLLRVYYSYSKYGKQVGMVHYPAGDWRCVVDWAKAGPTARQSAFEGSDLCPDRVGLPPDFVHKTWCLLCDRHQRVISEAVRDLLQVWKTGFDSRGDRWTKIDGYAEWPKADPKTGRPAGWTDRNLYRYAPDDFEKTAARQGIQAASQIGIKVSKTRVGLKCLEFVQFDDHEFDFKINFPGQLRSMRPRCFAAADVLTSRCFNLVAKPTFWDADDQVKKTLTEKLFMWFQLANLCDVGYRTDTGSVFHVEHGTAATGKELAERIWLATNKKVSYARSGRFHKPAHGGQFAAPSGGNFRFKAIIEVYWRLINDRLDSLAGQVGKDRLHAPEELERADAYVAKLLKASAAMEPERAAQLIIPRLTWEAFLERLWGKIAAIDADDRHEIEGWQKAKFVIQEFRMAPDALDWQPLSQLPALPGDQALVIYNDDRCNRSRQLSRFEAWQSVYRRDLAAGLITRLPLEAIPAIVGPRNAIVCNGRDSHAVRGGVFTIEDSDIDSDPMEFIAADSNGDRLREGERFVCYLNPVAATHLIVCNSRHQVIAVCPRKNKPAANDEKAVAAELGMQRSWQARALAPMRDRNAEDARAVEFMKRHNAALMEGGKTEAEKARSKTLKRAALTADALLNSDAQPAEQAERPQEARCASFSPESLL